MGFVWYGPTHHSLDTEGILHSEVWLADPWRAGNGIINADGDFWKLQRKAGLAFLNTANLRVLTDVALPRYLSETVDDLMASVDRVVDLQHIFHEITSKVMGKMAYNARSPPQPRWRQPGLC